MNDEKCVDAETLDELRRAYSRISVLEKENKRIWLENISLVSQLNAYYACKPFKVRNEPTT